MLCTDASAVHAFGDARITDTVWTTPIERRGTRAVSNDGSIVVYAGADSVVRVFDGATGIEKSNFKCYIYPTAGYTNMCGRHFLVSETGKYVVVLLAIRLGGIPGWELIVHDVVNGTTNRKSLPDSYRSVLLVSERLMRIYIASYPGPPKVLDISTLDSLGILPGLDNVGCLEHISDSTLLAVGSFDLGTPSRFQGGLFYSVADNSIQRKVYIRPGYCRVASPTKAYVFKTDGDTNGNTYSVNLLDGSETKLKIWMTLPTTFVSADTKYMTISGSNRHVMVNTQTDEFVDFLRTYDVAPFEVGIGDLLADGKVLIATKYTDTSTRLCRFSVSTGTTSTSSGKPPSNNIVIQQFPGSVLVSTRDNAAILSAQLFAMQGNLISQSMPHENGNASVRFSTESIASGSYFLRVALPSGVYDYPISIAK